jgi:hypothetical protein
MFTLALIAMLNPTRRLAVSLLRRVGSERHNIAHQDGNVSRHPNPKTNR